MGVTKWIDLFIYGRFFCFVTYDFLQNALLLLSRTGTQSFFKKYIVMWYKMLETGWQAQVAFAHRNVPFNAFISAFIAHKEKVSKLHWQNIMRIEEGKPQRCSDYYWQMPLSDTTLLSSKWTKEVLIALKLMKTILPFNNWCLFSYYGYSYLFLVEQCKMAEVPPFTSFKSL